MTELANMPRTLIALACSLAKSGVLLSPDLPVYVRDVEHTWTGYINYNNTGAIITAPTLERLEKELLLYWEVLHEEEIRQNKTKG